MISVIDGPTWLVDYDGDGSEPLFLDGVGSHTHEPGHTLSAYEWRVDGIPASSTTSLSMLLSTSTSIELEIWDDNVPPRTLVEETNVALVPPDQVPGVLTHYHDASGVGAQALLDSVPATVDYIEPEKPQRTAGRRQRMLSRGTIALEAHDPGSSVSFRSVKIRLLPDDTDPSIADRPSDEGYGVKENLIDRLAGMRFPVIDYHVHLRGGMTVEKAVDRQAESHVIVTGVLLVSGACGCANIVPTTRVDAVFRGDAGPVDPGAAAVHAVDLDIGNPARAGRPRRVKS